MEIPGKSSVQKLKKAVKINHPSITFEEWVVHWGQKRLDDRIEESCANHKRQWARRAHRSVFSSFPAWELCLGGFWIESLEDWHSRWADAGGRFYEGRMIAPKWSEVWNSLSSVVPDPTGLPYPPFSTRSCVTWFEIDSDEAILLGVLTESELKEQLPGEPTPLIGKNGKPLPKELIERLLKDRPSREERVAKRKALFEAEIEAAREAYDRRNGGR